MYLSDKSAPYCSYVCNGIAVIFKQLSTTSYSVSSVMFHGLISGMGHFSIIHLYFKNYLYRGVKHINLYQNMYYNCKKQSHAES